MRCKQIAVAVALKGHTQIIILIFYFSQIFKLQFQCNIPNWQYLKAAISISCAFTSGSSA